MTDKPDSRDVAAVLRHYANHHPLDLLSPAEIQADLLAIAEVPDGKCPVCEKYFKTRPKKNLASS